MWLKLKLKDRINNLMRHRGRTKEYDHRAAFANELDWLVDLGVWDSPGMGGTYPWVPTEKLLAELARAFGVKKVTYEHEDLGTVQRHVFKDHRGNPLIIGQHIDTVKVAVVEALRHGQGTVGMHVIDHGLRKKEPPPKSEGDDKGGGDKLEMD